MSDFDWTETAIGRLRALWAEGHSTAEIGRRMGASKNAIVGKAHRVGLFRGSPIKTGVAPAKPKVLRAPRVTLPVLVSHNVEQDPVLGTQIVVAVPIMAPPAVQIPPPAVMMVKPMVPPMPRPIVGKRCLWPLSGGTRTAPRSCDAVAVEWRGKQRPYCEEHCEASYIRPTAAQLAGARV